MPTLGDYEIAQLDAALSEDGEDIILRRVTGTNVQSFNDVEVRAFVRKYRPDELTDSVIQGDSLIIMSSTQIDAEQWPGGTPLPSNGQDARVPRKNDKIVVQGRTRNVEAAAPIYLSGQLVRIDIQARG